MLGLLVLVLLQAPHPGPASAEQRSEPAAEAPDDPTPETLEGWLSRIDELRAARDREGARRLLEELLGSEAYAELRNAELDAATACLEAIDGRAFALDERAVGVAVNRERVRRLSEVLDPDDRDLLLAQSDLARALADAGDLEGALALDEHVHAAFEDLLPPDDEDLLVAKQGLAMTRRDLGDLPGALALEEQVFAARERALDRGDPAALRAAGNLATTLSMSGRLERARSLQERVVEVYRDLGSLEDRDALTAQENLSWTYWMMGDLERAHALEEHVHQVRARTLPADDPDLLDTKGNLAVTRAELGDLEGALDLEEEVHAAYERLRPPDHPDLLLAKGNLAATRADLGDLTGALALEEEVHEAYERLLDPDHPDLLVAKQNLAVTRAELGDLEGALELLEYVYEAFRRLLPPDHPDILGAESNLATVRRGMGDLEGALELEERVCESRARRLPPDHPLLLIAKHNLAATRGDLGDLAGALELEEEVYAGYRRIYPPGHPRVLLNEQNLAVTRAESGDLEGAVELGRSVLAELPGILDRVVTASPRRARETVRSVLDRLAGVREWTSLAGPESARAAFEVLETARFVVGLPFRARLASLDGDAASDVRARLHSAERDLDELVSAGPDEAFGEGEEASREWRAAVRAAALRRDGAQRELLERLGEDRSPRVTFEAVRSALPEGHAAVGITKLECWRWNEETEHQEDDGPHYLAQVVAAGRELQEVDLGPAEELERLVDAWRRALGAPISRGADLAVADGGSTELETGRALRRALVDPLLAALGERTGARTLHLGLDDALFTVPLEALPLEPGTPGASAAGDDAARLGDLCSVRYESSLARLLRPAPELEGEASVAAVGAVDFDAANVPSALDEGPHVRLAAWGSWGRLSATDAEVRELAYQAETLLETRAVVLRGADVTQRRLAEVVRGKRYVHLATHGWFLPRTARKSILDDEPGGAHDDLFGNRETVSGFAPWTLCGLVLSGANAAKTDAERSARLLTAQELADFDLTSCDLAVLSACETNVGIARAGQGIQSLQTALLSAGARTSITSLWAVQDWPTQSLMKRFYDNLWERGMGKADALWAAKCALRAEGQPPHVWAGWVLCGDPD